MHGSQGRSGGARVLGKPAALLRVLYLARPWASVGSDGRRYAADVIRREVPVRRVQVAFPSDAAQDPAKEGGAAVPVSSLSRGPDCPRTKPLVAQLRPSERGSASVPTLKTVQWRPVWRPRPLRGPCLESLKLLPGTVLIARKVRPGPTGRKPYPAMRSSAPPSSECASLPEAPPTPHSPAPHPYLHNNCPAPLPYLGSSPVAPPTARPQSMGPPTHCNPAPRRLLPDL